jgi:hypothetical protein
MQLYVKLDANLDDDEEILGISALAETVFVRSLRLAKRRMTDGAIGRRQLQALCARMPDGTDPAVLAGELVDVGLWVETDTGWTIPSWAKHNPTVADLEARRDDEARRKKQWRDARTGRDIPAATTRPTGGVPDTDDVPPPAPVADDMSEQTFDSRRDVPTGHSVATDRDALQSRAVQSRAEQSSTTPSARSPIERAEPDPPILPPWDQAHGLLANAWPDEPDYVVHGWAGELAKLVRRIRHPYPADVGPAAMGAILANTALAAAGARPSLLSNPDRARLLSQIEAVMRATPPPPGAQHVDTQALLDRWHTRITATARTRHGPWTTHDLATRTVATWDQPEPTPAHPAGRTNETAGTRQRDRIATLAGRITEGTS